MCEVAFLRLKHELYACVVETGHSVSVLVCLQGCVRYVNPRHCICSCLCEHVVDYFLRTGECVFVCIQTVWKHMLTRVGHKDVVSKQVCAGRGVCMFMSVGARTCQG